MYQDRGKKRVAQCAAALVQKGKTAFYEPGWGQLHTEPHTRRISSHIASLPGKNRKKNWTNVRLNIAQLSSLIFYLIVSTNQKNMFNDIRHTVMQPAGKVKRHNTKKCKQHPISSDLGIWRRWPVLSSLPYLRPSRNQYYSSSALLVSFPFHFVFTF